MVARQAHNLKVAGSNPAPAPNLSIALKSLHLLSRGAFTLADFSNFSFLSTFVMSIPVLNNHRVKSSNQTLTLKRKLFLPEVFLGALNLQIYEYYS